MNNRPQVLMLGNGLNLAYGGVSWGTLLKEISVREDIPERLNCPMPMQAILHTNNDIKTAMEKKKSSLYGNVGNAEQRLILQNVLRMGFDDILTTNYSYELEIAALGLSSVKESQIKKMNRHTPRVGRVESKYLLHSYNELNVDDVQNRVWHIHGEARKPDSMILGHYYYAILLGRMIDYVSSNENRYESNSRAGKEVELLSWLDSFILGDVYVLGFGFDVSEFDLWWLLNRKKREKAPHGDVYFFEPRDEGFNERIELLKLLGVKHIDCDIAKPEKDNPLRSEIYKEFYCTALSEMEKRMGKSKPALVGG